ncbi:MAG: hypothetical protein Q8Q08_02630 [Candidatus Omnitrophota bacterium]|nr:hypothetical protein [Candidatus Omnitrophota bacterium]MDZ4243416.1 hypothetical protein [Candidatus Omnitrophota bacterium]
MNLRVFLCMALLCPVFGPAVADGDVLRIRRPRMESVVGIIQKIGRNDIEIIDENDQWRKRFIVLIGTEPLQAGDRVRIYYRSGKYAESIQKMTPLEYKKDGQNLGYLYRSE